MNVESLLLGAVALENGRPRRVATDAMERWAADTVQAARVPAGIRLGFTGDAQALEIDVETSSPLALATPLANPDDQGEFTLYVDGERRGSFAVDADTRTTVRIPLPPRVEDARVEIHLPEMYEPRIHNIRAIGGSLRPLPRSTRWVAYGDSITQGWTSSDPGVAWTARAARATGFDLVNLGFAGAARGELPVAAHLAATVADVITIAWGTNCWAQIEMDAPYIRELMRLFLRIVRAGHPETPILVISPVLRPAAEHSRNGSGATLSDLRGAIEGAVGAFRRDNADAHLHMLGGRELIAVEQLDADGIHPDDAEHALIGAAVAAELTRIVG